MTHSDPTADGSREGRARRDAAHALLEAHRDAFILRARRTLLARLLDVGTATADDVADAVGPLPESVDPRFLGSIPGPLARAGIIRAAGFTRSSRPIRHASILTLWELSDRAAALNWLASNPERLAPEPLKG